MPRLAPILALAAGAGGLLLALGAAASPADEASASAWAVQITVPGAAPAGTPILTAPGNDVASGGAFAYPSDGSIVSAGSTTVSVSSTTGSRRASEAAAAVTAVSLFGGEIVANAITGDARALAKGAVASGEPGLSGIEGLAILGKQIVPAPNERVALSAMHGGLPAGSEIAVGHAEAAPRLQL